MLVTWSSALLSDWWFQAIFRRVCLNSCNSHCRADEDDRTLFQFNISSISVHEDTRSSSTSPNKHLLTKVNHFQFRLNNMQIFSSGDFSMGMFKTFIINNEKRKWVGGPLMQCYNCSRSLLYFCKLRLILDQIWVQQQQKMDLLSFSSFCQVL